MITKQRKKICWNCDGSVTLEAENCPYCGVYLNPLGNDDDKDGLFAPPYRLEEIEEEAEVPPAPYASRVEAVAESKVLPEPLPKEPTEFTLEQKTLLSLSLILAGAVFFIFGLALFLFSNNGFLTLSWNANYWFIYLIISLPILAIGVRFLGNIKN